MQSPTYYLYNFTLHLSTLLLPHIPDGPFQLTWHSHTFSRTYTSPTFLFLQSSVEINSQLTLQQILIKPTPQSSFQSLQSEITVERVEKEGVIAVAILKIDLHDLAMSDQFSMCLGYVDEVKMLRMLRVGNGEGIGKDAWIGISLGMVEGVEVEEGEVREFRRKDDGVQDRVVKEECQVQQHPQIQKIQMKKIQNSTSKAHQPSYQSIMRLLNGKDYIISQLQQKSFFLIQLVKQHKSKLTLLQKQQIPFQQNIVLDEHSDGKSDRSKSVSQPKPSSRKEQSVKSISILVREPSGIKENLGAIMLTVPDEKERGEVDEENELKEIQREYKQIVDELSTANHSLTLKIQSLQTSLQQLHQAKSQLYSTKKRSILISQQNQNLRKSLQDIQFQLQIQIQNNNHVSLRINTEKNENRLLTCASGGGEEQERMVRMESQVWKMKERTFLEEIERLRGKVRESSVELKREKSQRDEREKSPSRAGSVRDMEEMIRSRVGEISVRFSQTEQENKQIIFKLQGEVNQLTIDKRNNTRELQNLTKKNQSLREQHENMKEVNHQNEKKMVSFNRMQVKLRQLQDFNKKLQQNIQKQQYQLREKHKQFLQFSYNRALPSTRLKQQKLADISSDSTPPQHKKRVSNVPLLAKRSELRHSIMEMEIVIKDNREKLSDAVSKEEKERIEKQERLLKENKDRMKSLMEELNVVVEEEPVMTPTGRDRDGLGNRWQAQQILQENNELKAYVKTLLKKVVALETITPVNKLDLVIKQRQITQNQKRLLESIQDILVQISSNDDIEKQSFINNVSQIKVLYSQQMGIVQDEFKKIMQYKIQLSELESNLNKREEKLNILEHLSASKRLSVILPENKWNEADQAEFTEMKRKEKQLKTKVSTLQAKILSEKTEFDKDKQDIMKKSKQEQKKYLSQAKQANQKQLNNWKNQLSQFQKRLRQRQIQSKQLSHSLQLSKTSLQNQQRLSNMRISQHNIKTQQHTHRIAQLTQQLNTEILKNKTSMGTIKELNSNMNKLTGILETKQGDLQHLEEQYKEFREESQDLVVQMEGKYRDVEERMKGEIAILEYQIERLKGLVEEEVIKSVKFEDEYKVVCMTINSLQRQIEQLHLIIQQKQQIIQNLTDQHSLKSEQIHIMQDQYNKLLLSLAQQNQHYISLKAEYTSLQLQYETAESHILNLEGQKIEDRNQFEEILDERDKESRGMVQEINGMLREHNEKEIEYRKKESQFEMYIGKMEQEMEGVRGKEKKLEEEMEMIGREREELRLENNALLQQLQKFGKRDRKKRRPGVPIPEPALPSSPTHFLIHNSKNQIQKQPSHAGSGVEGHKSSSLQFQHQHKFSSNYDQQLFTPMSAHNKSSPPNMDQGSHHQFLYPGQIVSNTHVHESHPQIRVTDVNGEEIVGRSILGRSGSISGKVKFGKSQPLQQVFEQSIEKHSEKHSNKSYEKEDINNYSDDESEQRKQQLQNLHRTIQSLTKQLSEKKLIITDLETINRKNQQEMLETKKYLESSIKRKGTIKRSIKDIGNDQISELVRENKEENIIESLKEMQYIGEEIDQLQQDLRKVREINKRYQQSIVEMREEMEVQQQENQKLSNVIQQMQEDINRYRNKQHELILEIEKVTSEIQLKNSLIVEFQQVIKSKQQEQSHSSQIISGLQHQLQQLLVYKERLEQGLQQTTQQLMMKQKQLIKSSNFHEELSSKITQLTDQLFQSRQQSDNKSSLLQESQILNSQYVERIQVLEKDLEGLAGKYLILEDYAKSQKEDIEEFGEKFKGSSEKQEQGVRRLVEMQREKGLLELEIKELNGVISLKQRTIQQTQRDIKEIENEIIKQVSAFERQREGWFEDQKLLQQQLQSKDINISLLKNDIQILLQQTTRLKSHHQQHLSQQSQTQSHLKSLLNSLSLQLSHSKSHTLSLQTQIQTLTLTISSLRQQIQQLTHQQNMRGSLIEEVEKSNRVTEMRMEGELRSINQEIVKRMELKKNEIRFEYEEKLALKERDLRELKVMHEKEKRNIEEERYEMFNKKCELEETRVELAEKQEDYKSKILKYQGSIKQICGKLKSIQTQRPHIELFQQIAFQNQIFRNRITQLQQIVSFKQTVNNEYYIEELENMKARFMMERQEWGMELENYAMQVAELEERNAELKRERGREDEERELREENEELEKSVVRLETCEEELRRELGMLKAKREEEYRQYLSELRALRGK